MRIKGLKKVCGRTRNLEPGEKLQLLYDICKNEVFVIPMSTKYMGSDTIIVKVVDRYISMEGIKTLILEKIKKIQKSIDKQNRVCYSIDSSREHGQGNSKVIQTKPFSVRGFKRKLKNLLLSTDYDYFIFLQEFDISWNEEYFVRITNDKFGLDNSGCIECRKDTFRRRLSPISLNGIVESTCEYERWKYLESKDETTKEREDNILFFLDGKLVKIFSF